MNIGPRLVRTSAQPTSPTRRGRGSELPGWHSELLRTGAGSPVIVVEMGPSGTGGDIRDSFRQAALVSSKKPFEDFETEFAKLRGRLDKVRGLGLTPPDLCFKLAQRKVKSGDYDFDLDADEDVQKLPPASETEARNLLERP